MGSVSNYYTAAVNLQKNDLTFEEYQAHYNEEGWLDRKLTGIPGFLIAAVVQTTYHVALAIIEGVPRLLSQDSKKLEAELCNAARDLEEAFGWIVVIFNDQRGSYHLDRSNFFREKNIEWAENDIAYEAPPSPTPNPEPKPAPKPNLRPPPPPPEKGPPPVFKPKDPLAALKGKGKGNSKESNNGESKNLKITEQTLQSVRLVPLSDEAKRKTGSAYLDVSAKLLMAARGNLRKVVPPQTPSVASTEQVESDEELPENLEDWATSAEVTLAKQPKDEPVPIDKEAFQQLILEAHNIKRSKKVPPNSPARKAAERLLEQRVVKVRKTLQRRIKPVANPTPSRNNVPAPQTPIHHSTSKIRDFQAETPVINPHVQQSIGKRRQSMRFASPEANQDQATPPPSPYQPPNGAKPPAFLANGETEREEE